MTVIHGIKSKHRHRGNVTSHQVPSTIFTSLRTFTSLTIFSFFSNAQLIYMEVYGWALQVLTLALSFTFLGYSFTQSCIFLFFAMFLIGFQIQFQNGWSISQPADPYKSDKRLKRSNFKKLILVCLRTRCKLHRGRWRWLLPDPPRRAGSFVGKRPLEHRLGRSVGPAPAFNHKITLLAEP